jgi:hypothetical protein
MREAIGRRKRPAVPPAQRRLRAFVKVVGAAVGYAKTVGALPVSRSSAAQDSKTSVSTGVDVVSVHRETSLREKLAADFSHNNDGTPIRRCLDTAWPVLETACRRLGRGNKLLMVGRVRGWPEPPGRPSRSGSSREGGWLRSRGR